jgi:hypothetical protein
MYLVYNAMNRNINSRLTDNRCITFLCTETFLLVLLSFVDKIA